MNLPFKNLRSPAQNSGALMREEIAPIPVTCDPRVNEEPVNTTLDGERPIRWPAPQALPESTRPPMRLK